LILHGKSSDKNHKLAKTRNTEACDIAIIWKSGETAAELVERLISTGEMKRQDNHFQSDGAAAAEDDNKTVVATFNDFSGNGLGNDRSCMFAFLCVLCVCFVLQVCEGVKV
jgi:hypothetical protein